jgi:hypothetical protein
MSEISESMFFSWLDSSFRQDAEKRNQLYFSILEQIKQNNPQDAAKNILLIIDQEMKDVKAILAEKTIGGSSNALFSQKKGSFKRIE